MYLFFDTETTGLPKNWAAPISDYNNWPRMAELGWQLYDANENLIRESAKLIKPDNWTIPTVDELKASGSKNPYFFEENGMSTERCEKEGYPIRDVINGFHGAILESEYLIAHNMKYDQAVLGAECVRYGFKFNRKPEKVCTMMDNTISTGKWPKLIELHEQLFIEGFDCAHSALEDVKACARIFFELKRIGKLKQFQK